MKKRMLYVTLLAVSAITMPALANTSFKFTENGPIYTIDGKTYSPEDFNKMGELPENIDDALYGSNFLIENGELINYFGSESKIVIPNTVKIIGEGSISDRTKIENVTIGNSVTTIGMAAFRNSIGLKSINIPNSVTSIGDFAFQNCTSLREIKIPSSVKSIGEDAFAAEQAVNPLGDMSSKPLPKLVVTVEPGSYAEKYAKENGLTYKTVSTPITAKPLTSKVSVDGVQKTLEAYTISGGSYFKIRDLACLLKGSKKQFNVTLDGAKKEITMQSNKSYKAVKGDLAKGDGKAKTATLSTYKINIDGKEVKLTAYIIAGATYFNLDDIMKAFNVETTQDTAKNTITINTKK
ncbi:leucine-rich repeat domain-containing protein [Cellulosilyticum sp. I15G10I2]|uniref:leucine-rich repeat domain-containing protein n=1 Tax=Cellulosilyticum sp. I15G10I2 TaxID=1892843 RepID=UPI00085CA751|nr:leucine-rich repeat domain-containing protein [Cellulosilyticum sp. I15G10I2]